MSRVCERVCEKGCTDQQQVDSHEQACVRERVYVLSGYVYYKDM